MTATKYLNPKNDVAFKKIFGTERNKDILIHFINDIIKFKSNQPIVSVTFLKTIQDPEIAAKKTSIVDILCEDQDGNKYIVEMQVAQDKGFEKRAQYYAAKAYVSQVYVAGKYHELKEIVFLAIADFVMFPKKKKYKSDHVILDRETLENDLKDFSFTFLELPKFTKNIDDLTNVTEKWMYFFKHAHETTPEDLQKLISSDEIMERVYHELDRFYWTPDELQTYEQTEKQIADYIASMDQKFDEGFEKGEQIGIEKGKMHIARNMLSKGIDAQSVADFTELTMAEIKTLK